MAEEQAPPVANAMTLISILSRAPTWLAVGIVGVPSLVAIAAVSFLCWLDYHQTLISDGKLSEVVTAIGDHDKKDDPLRAGIQVQWQKMNENTVMEAEQRERELAVAEVACETGARGNETIKLRCEQAARRDSIALAKPSAMPSPKIVVHRAQAHHDRLYAGPTRIGPISSPTAIEATAQP